MLRSESGSSISPDVYGRLFRNCVGTPAHTDQEAEEHVRTCGPCADWLSRRAGQSEQSALYSAEVLNEWRDGGCDKDAWLAK
jgi:hypothetical protein